MRDELWHYRPVVEKVDHYRHMLYWVLFLPSGEYRTAYVMFPEGWQVSTEDPLDSWVDCHGGLTLDRMGVGPNGHQVLEEARAARMEKWLDRDPESLRTVGIDCAHADDKTALWPDSGIERTLEFCVDQCLSIIDQLWTGPGDDELAGTFREFEMSNALDISK